MDQLSHRYAQALFDGCTQNEIKRIHTDLLSFVSFYNESTSLRHIIKSSLLSHFELTQLITKLAVELKLSKTTINFINVLIYNNRLEQLPNFMDGFKSYIDHLNHTQTVIVTSAVKLSDKEISAIRSKLKSIIADKLVLENNIDESILGGLRLQYGSYYFDGTVNHQINQLEQAFRKLSYGT